MRLSGWILASLLALNACAFTQPSVPPPDHNPIPADPVVVMRPRNSLPSDSDGLVTPSPDSVPSSSAPVTTETREWFYIHGALNVRTVPTRTGGLIRTLQPGDSVQLGPKDANGWARLYGPGTGEAYVYRASALVQRRAPTVRSAASSRPASSHGSGESVAAVVADSAKPQPPSGGSSASPGTGGSVHVRGYYRRDGTYVRPHTRSRPGSRRRN
jgi:hypothetical protein